MTWSVDGEGAFPVPVDVPGRASPGASDRDGWLYTPALGEWIAQEYAEGTVRDDGGPRARDGGLWGLHHAMPDRVPPPGVVRAWTRQFPAFGTLMRHAEVLRAERLMEESVVIADTSPLPAPRVALQIAARQRLAEALDATRYGRGANAPGAAMLPRAESQPVALGVSDAELEALVRSQIEAPAGTAGGGGGTPA